MFREDPLNLSVMIGFKQLWLKQSFYPLLTFYPWNISKYINIMCVCFLFLNQGLCKSVQGLQGTLCVQQ